MPIRTDIYVPAGTVRINLQDDDLINAQAYKLGQLKYQFDQTPDQVDINRALALYSQVDFTIDQYSADSIDLYDRLFTNTNNGAIDANISIIEHDGNEYKFVYELKQENIKQNEKEQTISLRLTPRVRSNVNVSDVFTAASSVYNYTAYTLNNTDSVVINCLPAGDFISEAMSNIFNNDFSPYVISSDNQPDDYTGAYSPKTYDVIGNFVNGDRGFVIADYSSNVSFTRSEESKYNIEAGSNTLSNIYHNFQASGVARYEFNKTGIQSEFNVGDSIIVESLFGGSPIEISETSLTDGNADQVYGFAENQGITSYELATNIDYNIKKYVNPANTTAIDVLKQLAGVEGSYFGTGFSRNFYVYSLSQDASNVVTLVYDNVNDIQIKRFSNYLSNSVVAQVADANRIGLANLGRVQTENDLIIPNLRNYSAFVRGNENASKSLSIQLAAGYPHLNKATYISATTSFSSFDSNTIGTNVQQYSTTLERNLANRGLDSYLHILVNRSGGARIEFEYQGALTLFPYSIFQFDSSAPEIYQNKQFRITSIAYDFVKDIIKVVAYQVNNLDTPVNDDTLPNTPNLSRTIEYDIHYQPRWNLVGNPTTRAVVYQDPLLGDAYPSPFGLSLAPPAYYYEDGVYKKSETTDLYGTPYATFLSGTFARGYWVALQVPSADEVRNFTWEGPINASNIYGVQVKEGWNIIAGPGLLSKVESNTANIYTEAIYGFRNTYQLSEFIEPGRGYFVKADADGTIDIVTTDAPTPQANLQEDFKAITFVGDAGTQTLYFDGTNTNTNVNVANLVFPPSVRQTFDVRINNDKTNTALRNLRAIESNVATIDINQLGGATTLNIVPKLGDAASSNYQCTYINGYDIITAQEVTENVAVDIPPTTTQIQIRPMGSSILLPVRDIDFTNPDGTIPEQYIDRSDVLDFTPDSSLFVITVTSSTTAVNLSLGDEAQYNFVGFGIDSPVNGQEIFVSVKNPDSKQFLISSLNTGYSQLLLPGNTQIERSKDNIAFKFRYNSASSGWILVYENSADAISDPIDNPDPGVVATPVFYPGPGTYTNSRDVAIITSTNGANILYNTNGSNVYVGYTTPITLTPGSTYNVRAYATKSGLEDSEVAYGQYIINSGAYEGTPDLPVFSPENSSFYNSINVEIYTSGDPGRTTNIYYTTDATPPTASSTRYTGPITVYQDTLFRAVAKYDDSSELTDIVDKSYNKITSLPYDKWNLISHPFAYPLTERAIRTIFNSANGATFEQTDNKTYARVSNYIQDLIDGVDAPLPVKAEPGKGYWTYIPNAVDVNFFDYINTRFNLLSNDNEYALSETPFTLPYYWSPSNPVVGLTATRIQFDVKYWEIEVTPITYPYLIKLYLDDIVIRNYQSTNYTFDITLFASYNNNATFKLGIEEYDINKASTSNTNTAITVSGSVIDYSEEFTGTTGYYVRPYIEISESAQDTQKLKLYIRNQKLSAEPGFMLNTVSQNVTNGWSTIGAIGGRSNINTDGTIVGDIFSFSNGSYAVVDNNDLSLGRGYYVNFKNSNNYNIGITDEPAQAGANLHNDFKKIQFTHNDSVFNVFFDGTSANINTSEYTVPPSVAGNFDVRFNQDETNVSLRNLKVVTGNTINIDVQQSDVSTSINIVPKIGDAATSYYQCTFLDGDKIITAQNVGENTAVDVPITTSRIHVQPMGASIKLPVRARDIANDDGELLDSVPIAGATGAIADRIQYMNDSGQLTELITTGTADFIQAIVSRPEFSSKQNNVPSKSQVFLFSYDGTGGLTDNYISGFSGGSDGKVIRVINVGSNSIVLSANDTGSTAGNRILGSNVTLGQYEGATLIYIEDYTGTLPTTTIDGWIIVGRNN